MKVAPKINKPAQITEIMLTQRQRGESGFPVGKSNGMLMKGIMSKTQLQPENQDINRMNGVGDGLT